MKGRYTVEDIEAALEERLHPTVTMSNRLEGRPRRRDFERALKAEVRDALWMLTKQWQLGEFEAEDAGSPVFAKLATRTSPLTKYRGAHGVVEAVDPDFPFEAQVERRPIAWSWNGQKMHLDLRAQLGRQFSKMLGDSALSGYRGQFAAKYAFEVPARDESSDYIHAHRDAWQQYAALAAQRAIDGGELHHYLTVAPTHRASDGITLSDPGHESRLDALGVELVTWFDNQYLHSSRADAYAPSYLEYQFAASARQRGVETVLRAEEYAEGQVDWYSFTHDERGQGLETPEEEQPPDESMGVISFMPTSVAFEGFPDPRWWALEDRKTNFAALNPARTDLAKVLLMEFALIYANDWFLVPLRVPVGGLARIEGLVVTTNFGERFWIAPQGRGHRDGWHRWSMYELGQSDGNVRAGLLVPPSGAQIAAGAPLETVEFSRDEVANLVWAVESTVSSAVGIGRSGADEARETTAYHEKLIATLTGPATAYQAPAFYRAMTGVPENWIPFVPVHVSGNVREVQLQRSRMLRFIEGDPFPPEKVPPRTRLLRHGLDQSPLEPYFVHEEETPRTGARLTLSFRRARCTNGRPVVWLGTEKHTGREQTWPSFALDELALAPTD